MEHRRAAFYRLYAADDPDVASFWRQADTQIDEYSRGDFVHSLILATDEIIPDEPLPVYNRPPTPEPNLRSRQQRWARKLAKLLQLLRAVTPGGCQASRRIMFVGSDIEYLVICFGTGDVPCDYDLRWRLTELGIEYTTDSERGWRQHRRASDKVRLKAVTAARKLATMVDDDSHRAWLHELARDLEALPSMQDEHVAWLTSMSQKQGWWNWLIAAYAMTRYSGKDMDTPPLRHLDWATLARVIAGAKSVDEDDVAHALTTTRTDEDTLSVFLNNLHGLDAP